MKQGKIKKQKPLPEISEEEKPFELPVGWEWTRLINLGTWALGSGFPNVVQGNSDKEILMCKVSDMNLEGNEKFIVSTINTISKDLADEYKIKTSEPGTIIFPKIGGAIATNKRRILVQETAIDNNCLGIKPCNAISGEWFYLILSALDMSKYQSGTSIPAINQSVIGSIPIALPSLKMQEKILSYVITLMSLCDQLELHSLTSLDAHQQLVETLLTTLTDSQNADQLAENWSRISEHFDTLFTTEASIDALKQTILQLAVMGKLVPQDPNDEPASELLKRIAQEKAQLVKDGKMKKQKPLPPISDEEKPFELPDGWEWVKLGNILHDIKYGTSQKCDYNISGYPVLRIPNIVKGIIDLADIKYGALTDSELKDLTLNKNDLLFIRSNGSTNIVGQSTLVQHDLKDHAYAGYIIRVRLHNEYINARYINMVMKSNLIREQIEGPIRTTTGVKNINSNELMGLLVPLPPKNEQGIIIKKINEIDTTLSNLKVSIQSAQQTQVHLADALTDAAIN
ncbi:hypothetical protein R813_22720 [Salmonella enterica subsp. enterica serovar Tennessee]|nr:hypothetical protein R813_22720 [Salmonella enterica subsp. enterica serovar Tennessee]